MIADLHGLRKSDTIYAPQVTFIYPEIIAVSSSAAIARATGTRSGRGALMYTFETRRGATNAISGVGLTSVAIVGQEVRVRQEEIFARFGDKDMDVCPAICRNGCWSSLEKSFSESVLAVVHI